MSFCEQLCNLILTYDPKELQKEIDRINLKFRIVADVQFERVQKLEEDICKTQKEPNLLRGYCIYEFTKGKNEGKMCGNLVHNGGKFCFDCSMKKGSKSEKYDS